MRTLTERCSLVALTLALLGAPLALTGTARSAPAVPEIRVDPTVHVDGDGRSYVVDPGVTDLRRRGTAAQTGPTVAPFPLDQTFSLHSKPGSQRTIFLDFDGTTVTGTGWNGEGVTSGFHQGWSLDGDASTFNDTERAAVQSIWQRVAEDYAPFDVDVTTADPGAAAIDRTGVGDAVFGTRALISQSGQAWSALCDQQCGGVAYLDVFDEPDLHAAYQPAWVFANGLANDTKAIAEATSHEVGHNFALAHDGNGSQGYDPGHGSWAPIMGASYDRPISQWSKGDYSGANNQEDDLAIIAANGAPLRGDESTILPTGTAYITSRTDTDTFDLGSCSGAVTVTADPAPTSPDLDLRLSLLDGSGATLTSADPASFAVSSDVAAGMGASISTTVPAGTYRVQVDGVGNGTPVSGYDDYASIGAYTIVVSASCGPSATAPTAPTGLAVATDAAAHTATLTWSAPVSDGGSPVTSYDVFQDGAPVGTTTAGTRTLVVPGLVPGTTYDFAVRAVNLVGAGPFVHVSALVPAGAPGAPTSFAAAADGATRTVTLTWAAPATDGGSPVTGYEVLQDSASLGIEPAGATSRVVTGLARGATYAFSVRALNAAGAGPPVGTSVTVPRAVPTAPRIGRAASGAKGGRSTATATWSPPLDDGGAAIGHYRVVAYRIDASGAVVGSVSSDLLGPGARSLKMRLAKGRWRFAVEAQNSVGAGPLSPKSNPVTAR